MKTIKINTYSPVFQGFYGTIFECDNEEDEINEINDQREAKKLKPITYDECTWDYDEYHNNVSKECVNAIENKLQDILGKGIKVVFEKLVSPKEYNFANDSINVEIELNKEARETIIEILKDNSNEFNKHLKETYSSRSGFISWHSNIGAEWIEAIKTWDNNLLKHKLGAILEFILEIVEEYDAGQLYDDIETHSVCASNYHELIEE